MVRSLKSPVEEKRPVTTKHLTDEQITFALRYAEGARG